MPALTSSRMPDSLSILSMAAASLARVSASLGVPALLKEVGLLKKEYNGLKVLGNGKLTKKLTVQANAFSKTAEAAINEAGGKIEVI